MTNTDNQQVITSASLSERKPSEFFDTLIYILIKPQLQMNEELIKSMASESSKELFDYFKHNGVLDFERRIVAGKLLHERGFYKSKLQEEKNKVVEDINSTIEAYGSESNRLKKNKRKAFKSFGNAAGILIGFFLIDAFEYYRTGEFDTGNLGFYLGLGSVVFIGTLVFYKRNLRRLMIADEKDLELQYLRLKVIENEWEF